MRRIKTTSGTSARTATLRPCLYAEMTASLPRVLSPGVVASTVLAGILLTSASLGCHALFPGSVSNARCYDLKGRYLDGSDASDDWERARVENERFSSRDADCANADVARTTRGAEPYPNQSQYQRANYSPTATASDVATRASDDSTGSAKRNGWLPPKLSLPSFGKKSSQVHENDDDLISNRSYRQSTPTDSARAPLGGGQTQQVSSDVVANRSKSGSVWTRLFHPEPEQVESEFTAPPVANTPTSARSVSREPSRAQSVATQSEETRVSAAERLRLPNPLALGRRAQKPKKPEYHPGTIVEQYDQSRFLPDFKDIQRFYYPSGRVAGATPVQEPTVSAREYADAMNAQRGFATAPVAEAPQSARFVDNAPRVEMTANVPNDGAYRSRSYLPKNSPEPSSDHAPIVVPPRTTEAEPDLPAAPMRREERSNYLAPRNATTFNPNGATVRSANSLARSRTLGTTRPIRQASVVASGDAAPGVAQSSFESHAVLNVAPSQLHADSLFGWNQDSTSLLIFYKPRKRANASSQQVARAEKVASTTPQRIEASDVDLSFKDALGSQRAFNWFEDEVEPSAQTGVTSRFEADFDDLPEDESHANFSELNDPVDQYFDAADDDALYQDQDEYEDDALEPNYSQSVEEDDAFAADLDEELDSIIDRMVGGVQSSTEVLEEPAENEASQEALPLDCAPSVVVDDSYSAPEPLDSVPEPLGELPTPLADSTTSAILPDAMGAPTHANADERPDNAFLTPAHTDEATPAPLSLVDAISESVEQSMQQDYAPLPLTEQGVEPTQNLTVASENAIPSQELARQANRLNATTPRPETLQDRQHEQIAAAPLTQEEIAWVEQVKTAIKSLLAERKALRQRGGDVRNCDARLRLLYLVIGEYERSIQQIQDENDPLRAFWETECRGLETLLQNQLEEIDPNFVADRLSSGLDSLAGFCQICLRKALLVNAPACYGLYEQRQDPYNRGDVVYAYSELDYVTSRETGAGYEINVECRWRLLSQTGEALTPFETQRCANLSETKLRDIVLNVSVPLPENLEPGAYLLDLEVVDLNAKQQQAASKRLALQIAK
ncbi:MAG: hypothetical protein Q4G03_06150 [Planctomycetia bacterium]|nr:hypothetical protein [Planctomycetia bacterium]